MRRMKDRVLFLQSLCHWIVLYMSQKYFLISTALMEETDHTDEGIPCRLVKEEQMAAPLNKEKDIDH